MARVCSRRGRRQQPIERGIEPLWPLATVCALVRTALAAFVIKEIAKSATQTAYHRSGMATLQSERLELVPMTRALVEAELENVALLGELLGVAAPSGWPPGEYDRSAQEFFRELLKDIESGHLPWGSYYVVTRDRRTLVAAAGYHGPPDEAGRVEIGYSVVEHAQGRGYATEAVRALIARAFATPAVQVIVANTFASNPASIAVLAKCGFLRATDAVPPSVRLELTRELFSTGHSAT
jgi:RimJ/RimL family protein N-acetyltransferase